jgi:hypothetical protein
MPLDRSLRWLRKETCQNTDRYYPKSTYDNPLPHKTIVVRLSLNSQLSTLN